MFGLNFKIAWFLMFCGSEATLMVYKGTCLILGTDGEGYSDSKLIYNSSDIV